MMGSDIHFTLMVRLDESGKGVGGVGKFEKGRGGVNIDDSEPPPTPGCLPELCSHEYV